MLTRKNRNLQISLMYLRFLEYFLYQVLGGVQPSILVTYLKVIRKIIKNIFGLTSMWRKKTLHQNATKNEWRHVLINHKFN